MFSITVFRLTVLTAFLYKDVCPSSSPTEMGLSTSSSPSEEYVYPSMFGSSSMPRESSPYISVDRDTTSSAQAGSLVWETQYSEQLGIFTSRTFAGFSSTLSTKTPEIRPAITMTSTNQDRPATHLLSTNTDTIPVPVIATTTVTLSTGAGTIITEMHILLSESQITQVESVPSTTFTPTSVLGTFVSVTHESDLHLPGVYGSRITNSVSVYDAVPPSALTATDMMVTSHQPTIAPLLCSCPCWKQKLQGTNTDILKQLDSILHEVRQNLTLDKDTLSASIRKRVSATDPRKSATGVGATGTGVVTFFFGLVVFGDIVSFVIGCVKWFGKPINNKVG
ncbi:uncharacterized protein [Haliotis asinina]|uniref:uncharacterized protein isoform X2 n=1 Tax=Haliotis asinina TaxID=109174 RepID=UPI003531B192